MSCAPFSRQATQQRLRARRKMFAAISTDPALFELTWQRYFASCKTDLARFLRGDSNAPLYDVFDRISSALAGCRAGIQQQYWTSASRELQKEFPELFSTPPGLIPSFYRVGNFREYRYCARMTHHILKDPEGIERLRRLFYEEHLEAAQALRLAFETAIVD